MEEVREELKPCPFCGEKPQAMKCVDKRTMIRCNNYTGCPTRPYTSTYPTEERAIIAWNVRPKNENI